MASLSPGSLGPGFGVLPRGHGSSLLWGGTLTGVSPQCGGPGLQGGCHTVVVSHYPASSVTLDKMLNLSVHWFPHLYNRGTHKTGWIQAKP